MINPIAVKNKKEKLVSEKASLFLVEKVLFFTDHIKHSEDKNEYNNHFVMIVLQLTQQCQKQDK